jgi:hypothetical protein
MFRITIISLLCALFALPAQVLAHGKLNAEELKERFTNTTQHCRKEKDQSSCTTYFAADGTIKRRMHKDGARRAGTWTIDAEKDLLCITWKGKTKALCFDSYMNKDGTMDMYKGGKLLSTVVTFFPGNVEGL